MEAQALMQRVPEYLAQFRVRFRSFSHSWKESSSWTKEKASHAAKKKDDVLMLGVAGAFGQSETTSGGLFVFAIFSCSW